MAKKQNQATPVTQQRQSRKEVLRARKQERQLRSIRLGAISVVALVALVLVIALINEFFIVPRQVVASVGEQEILLSDWQERVRYERAQRVIFLENQLQAFGGDVGIVQQFGGQAINDLLDQEGLGQTVINTMADELVICQGLEARGITITDADIDQQIEETFNFFDGESPTPRPTATQTVVPTPSITPLPTAVITEVVPTDTPFPTATLGPTFTPQPTATPVTEEAFQTEYNDFIGQFTALGIDEATYRAVVRNQLCRERLTEVLAEENGISTRAPHASIFLLTFETEEEANEAAAEIESEGFLTVWNRIRSGIDRADEEAVEPEDEEAEEGESEEPVSTAMASELLWRTSDTLEGSLGPEVADAAFELELNEPSEVITGTQSDGTTPIYWIILVSGREERDLSEAELNNIKQENLQLFVDQQLAGNLRIHDIWRSRVPNTPILDSKFLAPPTATPPVPTVPPAPTEETLDEAEPTAEPEPTEAPADNGE